MSAQPPRKSRKLDWVWQLRIELLDTQPLVWRRLLVPADITLPKLDRVIQTALGWTNSHLHEFVINGTHYAVLDPDWVDDLPHVDERRVVLQEALGMVYLEAQSCGLPVVAFDNAGVPEAVLAGRTGLLVPMRDGSAFAEAIARLLDDAPLRRPMGATARAHIREAHELDRNYGMMEEKLKDIITP